MSLLGNMTESADIGTEEDRLGGSGPIGSGLYQCIIEMCYLRVADSGAVAAVTWLKEAESGRRITQEFWIQSGTAKGCKNYYERDGKKHYLPGYNMLQSMARLAAEKEVAELSEDQKVVPIYDFQERKEVEKEVTVLSDLVGKKIAAGIFLQTVDKNEKNAAGDYVPSGDTRDENEVDKFFRADDLMTQAEILAGIPNASFAAQWEEKWAGKPRNFAKAVRHDSLGAAAPGGNGVQSGSATQSLFKKAEDAA